MLDGPRSNKINGHWVLRKLSAQAIPLRFGWNYSRFPEPSYGKNCHYEAAQCAAVNLFCAEGLRDAHLTGANDFPRHENQPGEKADKAKDTQRTGESHKAE
jgi:hypothetical protein